MPFLATIGGRTIESVARFGSFWRFAGRAIALVPTTALRRRDWALLMPQFYEIGFRTVPVMVITGVFVGLVLAAQAIEQLRSAGLEDRMGVLVNLALIKELGPVLAGVMLAGRVGGALTAELGTMNVTEQLLALRSMGNDPVRFLVTPRFIACLALTPVLTCYADVMGGLGAWLVYAGVFGGDSGAYWHYTRQTVQLWDLGTGVVKAVFFGGSIGVISCYKGFHCRGGAEGVGRACTEAFVASFIVILVLDFFLNILINHTYEIWYLPRSLI